VSAFQTCGLAEKKITTSENMKCLRNFLQSAEREVKVRSFKNTAEIKKFIEMFVAFLAAFLFFFYIFIRHSPANFTLVQESGSQLFVNATPKSKQYGKLLGYFLGPSLR
jgi:hypothetical protein